MKYTTNIWYSRAMKKLIFFDLDGTLTEKSTWYDFNQYFGMSESEDKTLLDWYVRGIITYDEWDHIIVNVLKEKGLCTESKVQEFVQTLSPRPESLDLIKKCKELGYTTIILSGTMYQLAEHFKTLLDTDLVYTTSRIVFDTQGKFENIDNEKDEAPAKLRIFEKVCAEYGVDPEQTLCVGDGGNDVEIFKKSKRSILLGQYEKLKPHAWKQIDSLDEIVTFL